MCAYLIQTCRCLRLGAHTCALFEHCNSVLLRRKVQSCVCACECILKSWVSSGAAAQKDNLWAIVGWPKRRGRGSVSNVSVPSYEQCVLQCVFRYLSEVDIARKNSLLTLPIQLPTWRVKLFASSSPSNAVDSYSRIIDITSLPAIGAHLHHKIVQLSAKKRGIKWKKVTLGCTHRAHATWPGNYLAAISERVPTPRAIHICIQRLTVQLRYIELSLGVHPRTSSHYLAFHARQRDLRNANSLARYSAGEIVRKKWPSFISPRYCRFWLIDVLIYRRRFKYVLAIKFT